MCRGSLNKEAKAVDLGLVGEEVKPKRSLAYMAGCPLIF